MRRRISRALLKIARRLDPPPAVNHNLSANAQLCLAEMQRTLAADAKNSLVLPLFR